VFFYGFGHKKNFPLPAPAKGKDRDVFFLLRNGFQVKDDEKDVANRKKAF